MFKGERTCLFWAGLIILCFACVFLFGVLWSGYQRLPHLPSTVFLESLPVIVGANVFIAIGLRMMNSVMGGKASVFWVGLIILSLSSLVLFQEVWTAYWNFRFYSIWWNILSVPIIVGTVVFILLGYAMMKSGVKGERLLCTT